MAGIRNRKIEVDYINITPKADPTWATCGTGFSSLVETPSAQTSSKRYINMSSARQSITGYEWSAPFEADQIPSEEALKFILDIGKTLKTGEDAETDFVQVDCDNPIGETPNTYYARKRTIAVAVSEMPDNDGELGVNGDFLAVSDPIEGTFNTETKVFTEGTNAVTLSVKTTSAKATKENS